MQEPVVPEGARPDVVLDVENAATAEEDRARVGMQATDGEEQYYDCRGDHAQLGDLEQAAALGVTIHEGARGALLDLLYAELESGERPDGVWKEVTGVTKKDYLARVQQGLPVVELEGIGAQQVPSAIGGEGIWVPISQ